MALIDNILAYYKLNGNGNNEVGSPNGTTNNITFNSGNGKLGDGAGFNGSNSSVMLGNLSTVGNSNYSFSCWIKTSNRSTNKELVSFAANAPSYTPRNFMDPVITAGGLLSIEIGDQGGLNISYSDTLDIADGNWHHVVFTFKNASGFTGKIYVDGNLRKTQTSGTEYNFDQLSRGWAIGRGINYANGAGYNWFNGAIDEVGIWLKELSQSEVTELYNSGTGITYPFTTGPTDYNKSFLPMFRRI